jgi:hypothetical protein
MRNSKFRLIHIPRRGGFMLEIIDFTNKYQTNPPNPTSNNRLLNDNSQNILSYWWGWAGLNEIFS